ncbi:MAG: hypothetical protein ABH858_03535 [Candidatus Omnitrophota bacterium]
MKLGKTLIAAAAITIFESIVGALTCGGVFNWVYKLPPTSVWKPMEAPGLAYYIGVLLLGILLVIVYVYLKAGLPGETKLIKGLVFGLCVWAVGVLPGMFSTAMFMTVAPVVILYWTISGLIFTSLEGLIIAVIYGE